MTKLAKDVAKRFDEKFDNGLFTEIRNPDWLTKREDKWIWVDKTEVAKQHLALELARQKKEMVEKLEKRKETYAGELDQRILDQAIKAL